MKRGQSGFTLLEILIAIGILAIIMAMNSTLLQQMIRSTRQQGAVVTSQFETALGLEVFRNDLAGSGYGLLAAFSDTVSYTEPTADGDTGAVFSDGSSGVPRPLVHSNSVAVSTFIANSDYLVIKSLSVGVDDAANKWTYITSDSTQPVHTWGDNTLDMDNGDYMIVIKPRETTDSTAQLVVAGGAYYLMYAGSSLSNTSFLPSTGVRYIGYGVSSATPVMPFNRADYYVRRSTTVTGASCAPGTGTLFKAVANQTAGGGFTEYPVADCVANMQVVFRLDRDSDGTVDAQSKNAQNSYRLRPTGEKILRIKTGRVYYWHEEL
jgi:prepilin-type N-terminal cleavage/methylation domain-containing protein